MKNNNHEQGIIAIIMVLLLAAMFSVIISLLYLNSYKDNLSGYRNTQKEYLKSSLQKMHNWYEQNAGKIDANINNQNSSFAQQYLGNSAALLSAAGITPKYNIQAYITNFITVNGLSGSNSQLPVDIEYHLIYLSIPSAIHGSGTFDPSSNSGNYFTPAKNQLFGVVNGLDIETEFYNRAYTQLQSMSGNLETYFQGRINADQGLYNNGIDYWTTKTGSCSNFQFAANNAIFNCSDNSSGESEPMPISKIITNEGYSSILDCNANSSQNCYTNPWGKEILFNNSGSVELNGPPYIAFLESPLPWNSSEYCSSSEDGHCIIVGVSS